MALLGNPGRQYAASRHNVAWMLVSELTTAADSAWKEKFHGRFLREGALIYLKPETYMNRSGAAVQAAAAFFSVPPTQIAVVHDDMETPFGTVEAVWAGGHRGQNGVRSVAQALGTTEFWRLRIGLGRPPAGRKPGDWVLERFGPEEEADLPTVLRGVARFLARWHSAPEPIRHRVIER